MQRLTRIMVAVSVAFIAALKPPRGTWHHIAVTFEDTGLVETAEEGYVGPYA